MHYINVHWNCVTTRNSSFMKNKNCIVLNMLTITIVLIFFLTLFPAFAVTSNGSDTDSLQTYIVYVRKPDHDQATTSMKLDLDSWYHSFLPVSISNSINDQPHMLYCYKNVITGFAAKLTAEQAKAMETKKGFISAHVEKILQLHTTHTPNFLGLHQNSRFWKDSNMGKGVIIGVIDTGITPGHPSFSDKGMSPPPAKWKGKCELKGADCNNKLIGARNFLQGSTGEPPLDDEGHGTHTASTAAGNFIDGANVLGQANGTAVGIAPLAHLAMYKVCGFLGCPESTVYAAMDTAIDDGVDVLSMSLGGASVPFFEDPLAIGSFSAIQKGIFVSCSAGNEGPDPSTSSNEAPWILSVGASTTDRSIVASAKLGNQAVYDGETLFQPKDFPLKQFPLIYPGANGNVSSAQCLPGSVSSDIRGKLVLCERGGGERTDTGQVVKDAGGIGMILMNDKLDGYSTLADPHLLPAVHVSYAAGESIKAYINSTSSPNATIVFKGTVIGKKSAPEVASFSSRGPSIASPGILKPDIIGPGVSILAAWPVSVENKTNTKSTFNMISGTSMSCPHLSGVAALLKSAHPDWSPAAIKSAIMTTADIVSLDGKPIVDQRLLPADLFAIGAGHVNPSRANDPGLIYDIQPDDYIPYLCGLNYTDQHVQDIVMVNVQCSKVSSIAEAELNYPSFSVILGSNPQTYNRTVTNIGQAKSSYTHKIVAPEGVKVTVKPEKISFTEKNQKAIYSVTFTRSQKTSASFAEGYLTWVSAEQTVRSPIAVRFQ